MSNIIIDRRGSTILLTNKKNDIWHQLQYNSTSYFEKMDEQDCKDAFEEMVHQLREEIHFSFELPKTK